MKGFAYIDHLDVHGERIEIEDALKICTRELTTTRRASLVPSNKRTPFAEVGSALNFSVSIWYMGSSHLILRNEVRFIILATRRGKEIGGCPLSINGVPRIRRAARETEWI